ncbi:MAG TPA: guanylate kinase [Candidatus Rubrimentiphilum sp.]|nr:guanylate kinase [Candidatus Rubrimentiphilum sp.]
MPAQRNPVVTGPGLLFVVSGPSGAGKDTLVEALLARTGRLRYSVSATTRPPRAGERNGEHYFFVTREEFDRRIRDGGLLEWREYNENLYGTPRDFVEETLRAGYDLIMKPEVNGALAIKSTFPDAVLIFLLPDRFSYLRGRLLARRTETNEEIARRLEIAHDEIRNIRDFDYIVINEEHRSDEAVRDLQAILQAERFRIHRYPDDTIRKLEHS